MVQLSGRGASSWFMVPPLHGAATGARDQDQCCPTRGAKKGEGLQLQLPRSTQVPGHDPRRTTIKHNRHHREAFTPPSRQSSHLVCTLPPLPPSPLFLSGPHRSKESEGSQTWSTRNI
ncbi:hypothetical protein PBY51_004459 [Eleginops maclovinus]|uniref:Uncharacterized protein n=1 Tax=Eleginops maclovinus TaxID=56733 RepID=A0AAN7Y4N1_ELEMC|nr:hypothetical protein PBY51_004459 [Eleginops maclovinus]